MFFFSSSCFVFDKPFEYVNGVWFTSFVQHVQFHFGQNSTTNEKKTHESIYIGFESCKNNIIAMHFKLIFSSKKYSKFEQRNFDSEIWREKIGCVTSESMDDNKLYYDIQSVVLNKHSFVIIFQEDITQLKCYFIRELCWASKIFTVIIITWMFFCVVTRCKPIISVKC